jgi:hypothetical protein
MRDFRAELQALALYETERVARRQPSSRAAGSANKKVDILWSDDRAAAAAAASGQIQHGHPLLTPWSPHSECDQTAAQPPVIVV